MIAFFGICCSVGAIWLVHLGWSRMQPIFSIWCMCVCCFFYQCCRCVLDVAPVDHLCISQKEIVPRSTRWILPICFAAKLILNWIIMNYWFNIFFPFTQRNQKQQITRHLRFHSKFNNNFVSKLIVMGEKNVFEEKDLVRNGKICHY